jgi:serine/threonine protein kinase
MRRSIPIAESLIKRSGRLEIKLALEIAAQVAAGLAAIHEQNLVRRDIKPTNLMVRLKGEGGVTAKIIHLGLAKTLDESASEPGISSAGAFVGTPEFASPAQFAGVACTAVVEIWITRAFPYVLTDCGSRSVRVFPRNSDAVRRKISYRQRNIDFRLEQRLSFSRKVWLQIWVHG